MSTIDIQLELRHRWFFRPLCLVQCCVLASVAPFLPFETIYRLAERFAEFACRWGTVVVARRVT